LKLALAAVLASVSFGVFAQAVTDEPPNKEVPKKAAPKKVEPKKTAAPKKPAAPAKPAAPTKTTVYKNDPRAPVLRDKQGNVIPIDPNAYDVSSAVGPKK
jgi:hypothetical protein